jgi:hypothetical protein
MLGCFEFRTDDYIGRRMVVGFVFSDGPLPANISVIYNPDNEWETPRFHQQLKELFGQEVGAKRFGFYRNEITETDGQHDGREVEVVLSLQLSMDAEFDVSTLIPFLTRGNLEDEDPPVLSATFTNANWLDPNHKWGWPISDHGKDRFTPEAEEILVDVERAPALSFINSEPYWLSPHFVEFQVI